MKKILFGFIAILLLMCMPVLAEDYKYIRTYNADGQIIKEAGNISEYISASVAEYDMWWGTETLLTWGLYVQRGKNEWSWQPMARYSYSGTNNGWYIFVSTVGYHSEYFYIKTDKSRVRSTFMAGGNGNYKEYVLSKVPSIDRMAPTR